MLEDYEKAQVSTNLTCICSLAKSDEDQVGLDDLIHVSWSREVYTKSLYSFFFLNKPFHKSYFKPLNLFKINMH